VAATAHPVAPRQAAIGYTCRKTAAQQQPSHHTPTPLDGFKQVDLPKPLGLKFARGNDGGAYVVANDPKLGNTDPRIQVRVLARTGGQHMCVQSSGAAARGVRTCKATSS
jgi:hypothetical protein